LLLRLAEAPLYRSRRPWTPHLVRAVCRANLWCLGFGCRFTGPSAPAPAVIAANHSSWLDIFALNAGQTVTFVAKAEVAGWPGIGWLARATGTVFIRRDPAEAAAQVALLRDRLGAGGRIAFFPEGTSTDGQRVLPFKPALFAAFLDVPDLQVQPVTIRWQAPAGADPRVYGWWGNMDLGPHLLGVLARRDQGRLSVIRHAPIRPAEGGRKALAAAAEAAVRSGFHAQDSAA
jgi:1-acyl-sn-glycerol-3-phosphate acyltransferase